MNSRDVLPHMKGMFLPHRTPTSRRVRAGAALLATLVPLSLATALMATNQTVLVLEDERIEVIFLDEAPKAAPGPPIAAPPGPQVQPQQQEQQRLLQIYLPLLLPSQQLPKLSSLQSFLKLFVHFHLVLLLCYLTFFSPCVSTTDFCRT